MSYHYGMKNNKSMLHYTLTTDNDSVGAKYSAPLLHRRNLRFASGQGGVYTMQECVCR
jgi:hypothetical protein